MAKYTWGGYRPGSGRRPKGEVAGVTHHTRADISPEHPILVTMVTRRELGRLRKKKVHAVVHNCLIEGCETGVFRVCHYALDRYAIHLIVEANDRVALSRGMQGMNVRVAKTLNRMWSRNGSVFGDRYATQILATGPRVRRALAWLYCGFRRHAAERQRFAAGPDPYSSALYFDGWAETVAAPPRGLAPVARPRSALLARKWRRNGLLRLDEMPPDSIA